MNIYLIIDESGSMAPLRDDTIGGFNRFVADQKALGAGDAKAEPAFLHVVCFDTEKVRRPIWNMAIEDVPEWTEQDYQPGGGTPLLDAIGDTIKDTTGDDHMIVIITDGMENASRTWTKLAVKELLEARQNAGWKVLYMGANVDAFSEAGSMGVRGATTSGYVPNQVGTAAVYNTVSLAASMSRTGVDYTLTADAAGNPVAQAVDTTKPKRKVKTTK